MASLPRNPEIAEQFELLADLLELEGAESFRVIAYRRAATRMRETSSSVAQLALDGKAKELQGIGKTIEEKIVQIVEQGEIEDLTKRKGSVPPDVVRFMRLPGLRRDRGSRLEGAWHLDPRGAAGRRGGRAPPHARGPRCEE
jgi:DNA polymerase (family 10)